MDMGRLNEFIYTFNVKYLFYDTVNNKSLSTHTNELIAHVIGTFRCNKNGELHSLDAWSVIIDTVHNTFLIQFWITELCNLNCSTNSVLIDYNNSFIYNIIMAYLVSIVQIIWKYQIRFKLHNFRTITIQQY